MNVAHKNIVNEGARLKQILKDKGIKVIEFARRLDFSNQIAHYYLRKESIKRSTLANFCEVINITLDTFYNWNQPVAEASEETHHGKKLLLIIEQKGMNKTKLAERIGLSRRALYNLLEKDTLTTDQLRKILPGLDMSLAEFLSPKGVFDAGIGYNDANAWRDKYYGCLEDYKKLTQSHQNSMRRAEEEMEALRKEVEQLRAQSGQPGK
ncbi:helix-turn-helix transcriptional regulator [Chitinophaga horti]|uniref:Helix-turn-helix transcriptional regulator n=1 Tax=Chitinophaga horti TaxID=2920382 RepID=A0ABY6J025_9BACT|nr:helix-turn-helix transcriptional regulator [Chitinophaga horti]UYQ92997.1 helix-turn-helix transcriptional regulator [Chitinophaga horti]